MTIITKPTSSDVKKAREAANHTIKKAAETVYATQGAWYFWERGERKMPAGLFELYLHKAGLTRVQHPDD